ncbi:MAG: response regulator [Candidatus Sumerlaeaceae bacterium]
MRILILDDNADALLVLENFLKALGHDVSGYTDGTEALLWLGDVKPEMIIADLEMPNMDGFSFVQNVRARARYSSLPIVCITGTDATDAQIEAGGFAAVLRKPTTLADVMNAIEDVTATLQPTP